MFITIDRKTIRIDDDRNEDELKRIRNMIRAEERRLQALEADRKRRGYCPDCHVLLTIHGRCSRCQIIWNFHRTHH